MESITELINLTPHLIRFLCDTEVIEIPPSGEIARVMIKTTKAGKLKGIPVVKMKRGKITGLPDPEPGKFYIVSSVVAKQVLRPDVLCPDTTEEGVIRNGRGQVIASKRLQCFVDQEQTR